MPAPMLPGVAEIENEVAAAVCETVSQDVVVAAVADTAEPSLAASVIDTGCRAASPVWKLKSAEPGDGIRIGFALTFKVTPTLTDVPCEVIVTVPEYVPAAKPV